MDYVTPLCPSNQLTNWSHRQCAAKEDLFREGKGGLQLEWDCFDADDSAKNHLTRVWRLRNQPDIRKKCDQIVLNTSEESSFRGTDVERESFQSEYYWINAYSGSARGDVLDSKKNLMMWKWIDASDGRCYCKAIAEVALKAEDGSDFNKDDSFLWIFQDNWFIALRDYTFLGHDYDIMATNNNTAELDFVWSDEDRKWEFIDDSTRRPNPPVDRRDRSNR